MSFVSFVSFVSIVSFVSVSARERQPVECTTALQCQEMTLAAIAEQAFERAHDLAWRVFQMSPRGSTDAMTLLARAQSLSGRGDDAFVMLQRLVAAGGKVEDVDTSDDFRRVREHPRWEQLRDAMAAPDAPSASAAAPPAKPASSGETSPAPPAPSASAPPAPPANSGETSPAPPALPAPVALPSALSSPAAFAYDAVSARFILADSASDILRVVSEHSGNETTLVSAGWSGHSTVTAVAINRRNGDMWITAQGDADSALHRFQLVSGRLLQTFSSPEDSGPVQLSAVVVGTDNVYTLDTAGRRIFVLAAGNKALRGFAVLPKTVDPIGLAFAGAALYVSHGSGLLRVDLTSRVAQSINIPANVDATGLHSLAWHNGSLLAVQRQAGGVQVVRMRLNARGTTVTSMDVIEPAATTVGVLAGDEYHFIHGGPGSVEPRLSFQRVPASAPSSGRPPPKR